MSISFDRFIEIAKTALPDPADYHCRDYTNETESSHNNLLYAAGDCFTTVQLLRDGTYYFHFNGFIGSGKTLNQAEKDWHEQESKWFYEEK